MEASEVVKETSGSDPDTYTHPVYKRISLNISKSVAYRV